MLFRSLDAFVGEMLVDGPETATSLGKDKGPRAGLKRRLDERSSEARARQVAAYADRAKRLKAIPRASPFRDWRFRPRPPLATSPPVFARARRANGDATWTSSPR